MINNDTFLSVIHSNMDIWLFFAIITTLILSVFSYVIRSDSPFKDSWRYFSLHIFCHSAILALYFVMIYTLTSIKNANYIFAFVISLSYYLLFTSSQNFVSAHRDRKLPTIQFAPIFFLPLIFINSQVGYLSTLAVIALATVLHFLITLSAIRQNGQKLSFRFFVAWTALYNMVIVALVAPFLVFSHDKITDVSAYSFTVAMLIIWLTMHLPITAGWTTLLKKNEIINSSKKKLIREIAHFNVTFIIIQIASILFITFINKINSGAMFNVVNAELQWASANITQQEYIDAISNDQKKFNTARKKIEAKLIKAEETSTSFIRPVVFLLKNNNIEYIKKSTTQYINVYNALQRIEDSIKNNETPFMWEVKGINDVVFFAIFKPIYDKSEKLIGYYSVRANPEYLMSAIPHRRILALGIVFTVMMFYIIFAFGRQRAKESRYTSEDNKARLEKAQRMASLGYFSVNFETGAEEFSDELFEIYEIDPTSVLSNKLDEIIWHAKDPDFEMIRKNQVIAAAMRGEISIFNTEIVTHKTKAKKHILIKISPRHDDKRRVIGFDAILQDITVIKNAEIFFTNLISASKAIIIVYDYDTAEITDSNEAAEHLYGWTRDELLSMKITESQFLGEKGFNEVKERLEQFKNTTYETEQVTANAETINLSVAASKLLYQGRNIVFNICSDITHVKNYEKELVKARSLAEAANEAKSMFLANISHEIRTPLNAILGYSQIVLSSDENMSEESQRQIASIQRNGDHLLSIINNILQMSKIESGSTEVHMSIVNMPEFLSDISEIFNMRLKSSSIELHVINNNIPSNILTDEGKLKQIITNLIGNSIKFTEEGSVTLEMNFVNENLIIKVIDTGYGISEEALKKIFSPFEQSEAGKKYGGTGLGLSICKNLSNLLGGKISARANESIGTTFEVEIPIKTYNYDSNTEIVSNDTRKITGLKNKDKSPLVLVVDDSTANQEILSTMLTRIGINILVAKDGLEAVDFAKKHSPDLIFMDIRMPKMNGKEATKVIRETDKITPIVAVTASVFQEEKDAFEEAGIDDCIIKPYKEKQIYDSLQKYLNIEFTYESSANEEVKSTIKEPQKAQDEAEFSINDIPSDELEKISEAISMADLDAVVEIVEENKKYIPSKIVTRVKKLADNYELNKIKEIFKHE